ncbi:MAG: DNA polymerase III subunit beta [Synergistaceae bacterium]|nr:DNA polymerase III subunit beta [Synergistaceae bacterium]
MKLQINKSEFMKYWQIAERCISSKSAINALTGVLVKAGSESGESIVRLEATDLKTSVKCLAGGALTEEEGEAVLPVKTVGELLKKAPSDIFTLSVKDGKGLIISGRNRYRFTTYSPDEFPVLPVSEEASPFCTTNVADLLKTISEGTVASTVGEEFPKYLGAAYFRMSDGKLTVVATDGLRLSLSSFLPAENGENCDFLLPVTGIRELQRLLSSLQDDTPVVIAAEPTLVFFQMGNIEFSVRRVDAAFPQYEKFLEDSKTTSLEVDRLEFTAALERVEIIVRDFNRAVVMNLSPGGDLTLYGRAPETGEAREIMNGIIDGEPMKTAFRTSFLTDGLKAMHSEKVLLNFNGPDKHMIMQRPEGKDFIYLVMPLKLAESEYSFQEEDEKDLSSEE